MYYNFCPSFSTNPKDITDLVPQGDPSLQAIEGTKVTHTTYSNDEANSPETTNVFTSPKWSSPLYNFNEPEFQLPSPIPVYVDKEEGGKKLLCVYDLPFLILRNDLIEALQNEGITEFTTHPVEIRDSEANKVYPNYSTFKPTERFVHAIIEEESEVSDVIDGVNYYDRITIDHEKVNSGDLFLHAIREKSSYTVVISEKIKNIFESIAPNNFIFSALFIEEDDDEEEDDDSGWGDLN